MFHWNFGREGVKLSWGAEVAYWQSYGNPPYDRAHLHGVDVGFESDGKTLRVYTEYQNGIGILGVSTGPVLETTDGKTAFGWQGSVWGAVLVGGDLRFRVLSERGPFLSPGLFFKLPFAMEDGGFKGGFGN